MSVHVGGLVNTELDTCSDFETFFIRYLQSSTAMFLLLSAITISDYVR